MPELFVLTVKTMYENPYNLFESFPLLLLIGQGWKNFYKVVVDIGSHEIQYIELS